MEAAWASCYGGGEAAAKFLARLCTDPRFSLTAQDYLEELGRSHMIPIGARERDFVAMAEMCRWLAHPNEFGEPPTEVSVLDTRELQWPPTGDIRRVWLIRYSYVGRNEDGSDEVAVGMVGSVTFTLFSETTAAMCPEDIYGLHCCWELQWNEDPRAPKSRTAKAGRKLLGI